MTTNGNSNTRFFDRKFLECYHIVQSILDEIHMQVSGTGIPGLVVFDTLVF